MKPLTGSDGVGRAPKRLLILGAAAVAASGGLAAPALAESTNAAQRLSMTTTQFFVACNGNNPSISPTDSFADIKKNADNTVSAVVQLNRAIPNTSYVVSLTTTPNTGPCGPSVSVQIDRRGHGTAHLSADLEPGQTGAFVAAIGPNSQLVTPVYVFGSK